MIYTKVTKNQQQKPCAELEKVKPTTIKQASAHKDISYYPINGYPKDAATKITTEKMKTQNSTNDQNIIVTIKTCPDHHICNQKNQNYNICNKISQQSKLIAKHQHKKFIRDQKKQQVSCKHQNYTVIRRKPEEIKRSKRKLHQTEETTIRASTEGQILQKTQDLQANSQNIDSVEEINKISIHDPSQVNNLMRRESCNPVLVQCELMETQMFSIRQNQDTNFRRLEESEKRLSEEAHLLREMLMNSFQKIEYLDATLQQTNQALNKNQKQSKFQRQYYTEQIRDLEGLIERMNHEQNKMTQDNKAMQQTIEEQENRFKKMEQCLILQAQENQINFQKLEQCRTKLQNSQIQNKELTTYLKQIKSNFYEQQHNYQQMIKELQWKNNQVIGQLNDKLYSMNDQVESFESQIQKLMDQVQTLRVQLAEQKSKNVQQSELILLDYEKAVQIKNAIESKEEAFEESIKFQKGVQKILRMENLTLKEQLQRQEKKIQVQMDVGQKSCCQNILEEYSKILQQRDQQIDSYQETLFMFQQIKKKSIVEELDLQQTVDIQVTAVILFERLIARIKVLESYILMEKEKKGQYKRQIHLLVNQIKSMEIQESNNAYILIDTLTKELQQIYNEKQKKTTYSDQLKLDVARIMKENEDLRAESEHSLNYMGSENSKLSNQNKKLKKIVKTLQDEIRIVCKLEYCEAHWHIIKRLQSTIKDMNIQLRAHEHISKSKCKKHQPL